MDRLVAVLPHLGAVRALPGHPRRPEEGRGRPRAVRGRPGDARADRARAARCARARPTGSFRRAPTADAADTLVIGGARFPMLRQQEDKDVCLSLADFVAPRRRRPTTSARSSSPPASAARSSRRASSARTTTTARSSSRRSPTGSPRPPPSGCTRARARDWGYARRAAVAGRHPRREVPRHPPRVRLPGVPRPRAEGHAVRAARPRRRTTA